MSRYIVIDTCGEQFILHSYRYMWWTIHTKCYCLCITFMPCTLHNNHMDGSINKSQPEVAEISLDHVEEVDDVETHSDMAWGECTTHMDMFPQTTDESLTISDIHDCDLSSPAAPSFSTLSSETQSEASLSENKEAFSHELVATQDDAPSEISREFNWYGFKIIGVAHVPVFEKYASVVPPHILYQFSNEMKKRSEVVSPLWG